MADLRGVRAFSLVFLLWLPCQVAAGARSFSMAAIPWYSTFNLVAPNSWAASNAGYQKVFFLSLKNVSNVPQNVKVTGRFSGGRFVGQADYSNRIQFGIFGPGFGVVSNTMPGGVSPQPPGAGSFHTLTPTGTAGDEVEFVWLVDYAGPGVLGIPSMWARGRVSFLFEVEEDRGAVTASLYINSNNRNGGIRMDNNVPSVMAPTWLNVNGGRPF